MTPGVTQSTVLDIGEERVPTDRTIDYSKCRTAAVAETRNM